MLTVTNYRVFTGNSGEKFVSLELTGGIEMIQSKTSGDFYTRTKRCFIPFTDGEEAAELLLGTLIPGSIQRVKCEPYDYQLKSGEVATLNHKYKYQQEEEEPVPEDLTEMRSEA